MGRSCGAILVARIRLESLGIVMTFSSRLRVLATLALASLLGTVHCGNPPDLTSSGGFNAAAGAAAAGGLAPTSGGDVGIIITTGDSGSGTCDSGVGDECGGASSAPDPTCGDGLINVAGEVCDDRGQLRLSDTRGALRFHGKMRRFRDHRRRAVRRRQHEGRGRVQ